MDLSVYRGHAKLFGIVLLKAYIARRSAYRTRLAGSIRTKCDEAKRTGIGSGVVHSIIGFVERELGHIKLREVD